MDLATSVNKKWFESLLMRIRDEVPGITWEMTAGTRSEILDRGILKLMQESGNNKIGYAPEAGSKSMIEKINKRLNFDKFFESVHNAVDLGLDIRANIIIGFPHETFRELIASLFLAYRLAWYGVKGVSIFKFSPLYGTILAREYFPPRGSSHEHYEKDVIAWAKQNMVKVVNPKEILNDPKDQFYAFLSNSTMVLTYFVCLLRRPKYIKGFYLNIKRGKPQYAVEIALYMVIKRFRRRVVTT